MKDKLSKRDWEMISAYMDGQLSGKKLIRFQARLSQEPPLQQALIELQKTRQALHNIPRLRVPRNFLLTPQMAAQTRRLPRLSPALGWASAAATFLFAIVMLGDLALAGGGVSIALSGSQPAIISQEPISDMAGERSVPMVAESDEMEAAVAMAEVSEIPEPEIAEGAITLEVAAAPEAEAASPETLALEESVALTEAPFPSTDLMAAGTLITEPITVEAEIVTQTARVTETEELFVFSATTLLTFTITDTLPSAEGSQHIEITIAPEDLSETIQLTSTPLTQLAESAAAEASQAIAETLAVPQLKAPISQAESQAVQAPNDSETMPQGEIVPAPTTGQPGEIWLGVETGLLLLALATGIAWVYLRRRGG